MEKYFKEVEYYLGKQLLTPKYAEFSGLFPHLRINHRKDQNPKKVQNQLLRIF